MKNFFFIAFILCCVSCANREKPTSGMRKVLEDLNNSSGDYAMIPEAQELQKFKKGKFQMNSETKIYTSVETIAEAYYMLSFIKGEPNNIRYNIKDTINKETNYGIYLQIDEKITSREAYRLEIKPNFVRITGASKKGVFYGIQSLRQLMPDIAEEMEAGSQNKLISYIKTGILGNNMTVPYCEIYDYPKFPFRAMKLDVSRHFFEVDFIKEYIDILAMHKINYFVWHLSDDQGWRLEIKKYPDLTNIGARRKGTMLGKDFNPEKIDNKEYYKFYTQEEIREVVKYAQDRHISIIPDISLPGHASAILAAYPGLGGVKEYSVPTSWGTFENYLYPTAEAIDFLSDVFREIAVLFPGSYLQISGMDFSNKKINDPYLNSLGFRRKKDLDNFFLNNIKPHLKRYAKKLVVPTNRNAGNPASEISLITTKSYAVNPAKGAPKKILGDMEYLDFSTYPEKKDKKMIAFGGSTNTRDVYMYHKLYRNKVKNKNSILGAQASLDTEYFTTAAAVEKATLPRLSALSEIVWSNTDSLDWYAFKNRFDNLKGKFKKQNYKYSNFY